MSFHIYGIRHHGPGSARTLRAALETLEPDLVLVEGPPDAQTMLPLMIQAGMRPPVALLIYDPASPSRAVYYPFAHFSPEWQALTYALGHDIPVRFFDLPQAIQFARGDATPPPDPQVARSAPSESLPSAQALPILTNGEGESGDSDNVVVSSTMPGSPSPSEMERGLGGEAAPSGSDPQGVEQPNTFASSEGEATPLPDPFALLAMAAGYADHEMWWEQQIEQRRDVTDLFAGIQEAMTAMRAGLPPRDADESLREAHMRQMMRAAQHEGYQRIAVVCGAWHGPALVDLGNAKADAALLKGLPKVAVTATWIPWTNSRLAYRSGYGAGITSPGWYEHLWNVPEHPTVRWMARAAQMLRADGRDTSSASVIEAVRLSETLAALRDLPLPGLAEMHEAVLTVLCNGEAAPMTLIRDRLEIGEVMGGVPPETPAVPLQRDLEAQQRRLRFKPLPEETDLDCDLREETHRAKSHLLHRLRLLGIEWGRPQRVFGKEGTFHEMWKLQWRVEFAVALIERNIWGNTVASAATAYAREIADKDAELPQLTALLHATRMADLPDAITYVLERVRSQAAVAADLRHLMDALPPLAQIARYSDVRGTSNEQITPVIAAIFERIVVGLPGACASLDDDAAEAITKSLANVNESLNVLNDATHQREWHAVLRQLSERESIHGLVRGYCCRLLLEGQQISGEAVQALARRTLSPVTPADQAAAWVAGVLTGSGSILLHLNGLWLALDAWMSDLPAETFIALLPLLRRGFAGFQPPERRSMGEKVKHLPAVRAGATVAAGASSVVVIDREQAERVMPVLAQILGVTYDGKR